MSTLNRRDLDDCYILVLNEPQPQGTDRLSVVLSQDALSKRVKITESSDWEVLVTSMSSQDLLMSCLFSQTELERHDIRLDSCVTSNGFAFAFSSLFVCDLYIDKALQAGPPTSAAKKRYHLVLLDRSCGASSAYADSLSEECSLASASDQAQLLIPSAPRVSFRRLLKGVYELNDKLGEQKAKIRYLQLARAAQFAHFALEHRYCGSCGSINHFRGTCREPGNTEERQTSAELGAESGGDSSSPYTRCTQCARERYPRISPCVIAIVTKGDRVLLAHAARHPEGMFSAVAGFIEAGEDAEQAIAREIHEELGIAVKNITYHSSACWPFPSQLMLGYFAEYSHGEVQPDGEEILEANWYRFDELPLTPPKATIAGQLISAFVAKQSAD